MGTDAEEVAAIEALDGAEWMGRKLKVNKAKPRGDGGSSGGRRGNNSGGYSKALLSFETNNFTLTS